MDRDDRNYQVDHDCKMTCMAEALGPSVVELTTVQSVFVPTDDIANLVRQTLPTIGHVNVNARMFPRRRR
jgi:hypothetical protein